jgi:pyruvate dehydrogenase E2 component (dihydrolipoamide acetyltransferase)
MSDRIRPIVMPKWGLAMQEGMVAKWLVEEGAEIRQGQEIVDIETSKIANVFESPVGGPLRRVVTPAGETVPVGALLAVVAPPSVSDPDIDAYVAQFQEQFAAKAAEAGTRSSPSRSRPGPGASTT